VEGKSSEEGLFLY